MAARSVLSTARARERSPTSPAAACPRSGPPAATPAATRPRGLQGLRGEPRPAGLAWMMMLHQGSARPRPGGRAAYTRSRHGSFAARAPAGWRTPGRWPTSATRCRTARCRAGLQHAPSVQARPARSTRSGAPPSAWAECLRQPWLCHRQRDHPVRPRRPRMRDLQQALRLWAKRSGRLGSYCKGDKRHVLHPRWGVRNHGPSRFRTDPRGAVRHRPAPGSGEPRVRGSVGGSAAGPRTRS